MAVSGDAWIIAWNPCRRTTSGRPDHVGGLCLPDGPIAIWRAPKQTGISTPGRRRGWECFIWDRIPTASGLLLGLCAAYHWKTLLNCFGALLMATNIFGVKSAIILRIINNIIGCCFGVLFYYVYNFIVDRFANARTGRS